MVQRIELPCRFVTNIVIHPGSAVYLRSCITLIYQLLKSVARISNYLWCTKWCMAKSKVGIVLFKLKAALGDIIKDSYSHILKNWCSFVFLLYFPLTIRLWNSLSSSAAESPITLTYLRSILILDNTYDFVWYLLYNILHAFGGFCIWNFGWCK